MSATNTFENDILGLIFTATAIANLADNAASSPATEFYLSLHTSDPGEAGSQTTGETTYTGYTRKSIARSGSGWTVSNGEATNDSDITFDQCTASPGNDITHVGIGTASSGAGKLLLRAAIPDGGISVNIGTVPILSASQLSVSLD